MARARTGSPTHTIVSGRPTNSNAARTTNHKRPRGKLESKKRVGSTARERSRPPGDAPRARTPPVAWVSSVLFTASLLSPQSTQCAASGVGFSPSALPQVLRARLPCHRGIVAPDGHATVGSGNAARFTLRLVVEELRPVAEPAAGRRHEHQGHRAEADHARPAQDRAVRVHGGEH